MLFNSIDYLLFLPIVFFLYWFILKKHEQQNILILVASYLFYGWWDWRFLSLILLSTIIDFTIANNLEKTNKQRYRKYLLWLSLFFNLGMLGFFKYYNFFVENWVNTWNSIGVEMHKSSLNIILPVGISFYTFQTLSYTIDVYKKRIPATKNFIAFAGFVSFFPQLVAGPIERATNLLPQFFKNRAFNYEIAVSGMRLILWGLFKKVVIADNCALYVNEIFSNYQEESGLTLILGGVYFAFQIYGDFSGYSDIAIGTARLFGFNLMRNFNYPYFSRDIAEFWRRWHISLSTWFRDYLYIPLGGSRGTKMKQIRNVFAIFLISGFWHGANWTFVFWGGLNALLFLPLLLTNNNRKNIDVLAKDRLFPSLKETIQIITTFSFTVIAWIFFRAPNISSAFEYIYKIFSFNNFFPDVIRQKRMLPILILFLIVEWFSRRNEIALILRFKYRYIFYVLLIFAILYSSSIKEETSFIYFQF